MPDPTWETISSSQAPALFDVSPYFSRWQLWHAFRTRDASLIGSPENDRMDWGNRLQSAILQATADEFRLELQPNIANTYERRGRFGCTIDGHLIAPDIGEILVEAKNVDWLRWKETWTEEAAPKHIEIQVQEQLYVRDKPRAIIPALIGGNEIRFYEREANPEIWRELEDAAARFFDSLKTGKEPDPLGSPLELPALAKLYPTVDPAKVVEDMEDDELAETIRQFAWAREQESFAGRIKEQAQAKLLARAGDAALVRARGVKARITKTPIGEAHIIRKPYVRTLIKVEKVEGEERPAPTAGIAA